MSGQAPYEFGAAPCSFARQQFITTVDITHGPSASLVTDTCLDLGPRGDIVWNGTFVFTAPSGTLIGTVNGTAPLVGYPIAIDFTLTVADGTRGFGHTSGTLRLVGHWAGTQNAGPVTGALTASLTH